MTKLSYGVMWGSNEDDTRQGKDFNTKKQALNFIEKLKKDNHKNLILDIYEDRGDGDREFIDYKVIN